jgi:glycosyltransferase involved in cell wall biosynthesis
MDRIATIVKGYPRLSETFIAQEILGLEQRGIRQLIVSLRHPTETKVHEINRRISADVLYLPEYLKDDPLRVRASRTWAQSQPGFARAWRAFRKDFARDPSANRRRRFGQACVLARELPGDIEWLHVHFLHTPASVARYTALIRGIGWSFSAHAKDIWTTPRWELREKLADAGWGATCTAANLEYLRSLSPTPNRLHLVYHGLDFSRFPPVPAPRRAESRAGDPFTIVSVGRAVEKKGYADLLKALALLPKSLRWCFEHVGGGPLADHLKRQAERLGLADRIRWHGSQEQAFVFSLLARADLFALPSRLTASGDRDGIPNVLMEAQAFAIPIIATDVSGIPELVKHGETGWLVEQRNPRLLADAIVRLMTDAALRTRLGEAGSTHVRKAFSSDPGIDFIAAKLRASLGEHMAA